MLFIFISERATVFFSEAMYVFHTKNLYFQPLFLALGWKKAFL